MSTIFPQKPDVTYVTEQVFDHPPTTHTKSSIYLGFSGRAVFTVGQLANKDAD